MLGSTCPGITCPGSLVAIRIIIIIIYHYYYTLPPAPQSQLWWWAATEPQPPPPAGPPAGPLWLHLLPGAARPLLGDGGLAGLRHHRHGRWSAGERGGG